jgi:thiol-disulfide isomerase/thioredoxin
LRSAIRYTDLRFSRFKLEAFMRWMISGLMVLAATVGLAGCAPAATNSTGGSATGLTTGTVGPDGLGAGDLMPELRLLNLKSGQEMRLSSLRGKPVLVNFWATWCGPCRAEIPKLNGLAQKYPKLTIIGVNVAEDRDLITGYLTKQATDYEVWHENKGGGTVTDNTAKLLSAWEGREGGYSIPFTVIVDSDGYAKRIISGFNERALENSVAALFPN